MIPHAFVSFSGCRCIRARSGSKYLPPTFTAQQRRKFFYDLRHYFWDDPHLYKEGVDGIIRRCVPEYEQQEILRKCHGTAYGGHHAGDRTAQKVLQSGFY